MSVYPPGRERPGFLATVRAAQRDDDLAAHTRREIEEAHEDLHRERTGKPQGAPE